MAYNGWTNKETWLVNLWMGDLLQSDLEEGIDITADYIESLVDEMIDETLSGPAGFLSDLLMCAVSEINYYEIAEHYEREEEDEEDDDS